METPHHTGDNLEQQFKDAILTAYEHDYFVTDNSLTDDAAAACHSLHLAALRPILEERDAAHARILELTKENARLLQNMLEITTKAMLEIARLKEELKEYHEREENDRWEPFFHDFD